MTLALIALGLALLGSVATTAGAKTRLLLGAICVGLASASLHAVAPGDGPTSGFATDFAANLEGLRFLQVVAGLLLLGIGVAWSGGWGKGLAVVTAAAALTQWSLFTVTGVVMPLGFAAAILAASVFGWLLLVRLRPGRLWVALDRVLLDRHNQASWQPAAGWTPSAPVLAVVIPAMLALLVPHLWTVLGGSALAAVAGWDASRRERRPAWILLPVAVAIALALVWSVQLAGPLGGWTPTLIEGPFSPRVAQVLALLVALGAWGLAGVWPWHGVSIPILLAPLAIAVVGGYATLLIPDGVQWWQPVFAPIALLAMMHALARRRVDQFLVAAGLFGLWTGTRDGAIGGALVIGTSWLMAVGPSSVLGRLPIAAGALRLAWLIPASGVVLIERAGVATQVGYTLIACIVAASALLVFAPTPGAAGTGPVASAG